MATIWPLLNNLFPSIIFLFELENKEHVAFRSSIYSDRARALGHIELGALLES